VLKHPRQLFLFLILCLGLACSNSEPPPSAQDIKTSIRNQVQSELMGNQKVVGVSIVEIKDKPGLADLEVPGSKNKFWTIKSQVEIKTTVAKKKLPLFKRKYKASLKVVKRQFRIWKNSQKKWVATPL